jgi:hypothetical protein
VTGIMTRLRIAFLFVAVVAGDYAALMLIDCHLIHFGVAAAVCGGSSVAAGLIAYADDENARRQHELSRRRRAAVARRRPPVSEHADLQAAIVAGKWCPLCGCARRTRSDSPEFADRQESRLCRACVSAKTQGRNDRPTGGLAASSKGRAARSGATREDNRRLGVTRNRVGMRRTSDDPRVEVST